MVEFSVSGQPRGTENSENLSLKPKKVWWCMLIIPAIGCRSRKIMV
jgi:hypothetical protein